MPPPHDTADASDFRAIEPGDFRGVDQSPDPSAMIAMMDLLRPPHHAARSVLLDRLRPEDARAALDVGCGTGDDLVEMARRMPEGARAEGVDASEAMIAEARSRAAAAGIDATFRVGNALTLPYPDAAFEVCRVKTVLPHVADPRQAIREMVRVTRPGGRVGALEMDMGTIVLDHPDQHMTRTISDALCGSIVRPWIGRQLHRLFREAGLTGLTAEPIAFAANYEVVRSQFSPTVTRLREKGVFTPRQADEWWSWLARQAEAGTFTGTAAVFVVTGTRPEAHNAE